MMAVFTPTDLKIFDIERKPEVRKQQNNTYESALIDSAEVANSQLIFDFSERVLQPLFHFKLEKETYSSIA